MLKENKVLRMFSLTGPILALMLAGSASAQEVEGDGAHQGAPEEGHHGAVAHEAGHVEHAPTHIVTGATGTALAVMLDDEAEAAYGGGVMIEWEAQEHVSLAFNVRVLSAGHAVELPMDLLVKVPFHVTQWFHPFFAVGPTVIPIVSGGSGTHFGGAAVAGADLWVSDHVGLVAEVAYNAISNHGLQNEAGGNLGVIFGF